VTAASATASATAASSTTASGAVAVTAGTLKASASAANLLSRYAASRARAPSDSAIAAAVAVTSTAAAAAPGASAVLDMPANRQLVAAMLIIGDEILSGFTAEGNLRVTSTTLASIGIPLKRVVIVSDDIDEIVVELRKLSQSYDVVFTSGGIGPTHDDVTLKAVARALNQRLEVNKVMLAHLQEVLGGLDPASPSSLDLQQVEQVQQIHDSAGNTAVSGPLRSAVDPGASAARAVSMPESMLKLALLPELAQLRFAPAPDDYCVPCSAPEEATTTTVATATAAAAGVSSSDKSLGSEGDSSSSSFAPAAAAAPAPAPAPAPGGLSLTNTTSASTASASASASGLAPQQQQQEQRKRTKMWPVLQCDNIFVLPGIPQFYADKMRLIAKHFLPVGHMIDTCKIVLGLEERRLVSVLDALVAAHTEVKFGSYPFVGHPEFKTIIVVEGSDVQRVEDAVAALLEALPKNSVLRVEKCREKEGPLPPPPTAGTATASGSCS
jgi:molybdopterin-biosynthesis enzyme MoeA-like protein